VETLLHAWLIDVEGQIMKPFTYRKQICVAKHEHRSYGK